MPGKLFIKTFGCQMNEYDSAKMADVLRDSHGMDVASSPEEADVLLLNTCSIREKAQEKVFSLLGRWKQLKAARPDIVIGVGGCVASQEGDAVIRRAPQVDMVFGPQTLHRLPGMIDEIRGRGVPVVDVSFPEIEKFDRLPAPRADGPSAFVSIMEGCSKYCSFCVVPYTRGEEISRPFDDVVAEVVRLAEQGVSEITLLGQNVNAYRGPMHDGTVEFSDSLVAAYADVRELAGFLHLPVQSGSDRILSLMKRGHTTLEYKQKIRKLREARPDISLSSDFIVGFPGETDRDFEDTMNLIAEIGFDQSFSFVYSRRPGTPAASLPDDVPMEKKQERLYLLQARIGQQAMSISEGMVGSVQRVLVERPSKKDARQLAGRTENMRWVNFDGPDSLIGQFVDVRITEALPNSLRGRIADASRAA
jgi:tRNA-2-methylthio-N6-dimethylallyladenosine synthase